MSIEIPYFARRNDIKMLEKHLIYFSANSMKLNTVDIEEALLQAILSGADDAIAPLILAGARRYRHQLK